MFDRLKNFFQAFFTPNTIERDALVAAFESAPVGGIESMRAELAISKYDLAHAHDATVKRLKVKDIQVSLKGGINFLGIRRFPVNMYPAELEAILACVEDGRLAAFLEKNASVLSRSKAADAEPAS